MPPTGLNLPNQSYRLIDEANKRTIQTRSMTDEGAPLLEGEAADAVKYRGGHLQIIAAAGSGKTEVVAQRVSDLLAEGISPDGIVAFTFTERAARSLKSRIERRVAGRLGSPFLDHLNGMFVGTIHSYCFRILQQHVAKYETFDVLDEHRLTAFLTREAYNLGLVPLTGKMFSAIQALGTNAQVVENELLESHQLIEPFRGIYERYVSSLDNHRFLTYGQIMLRAVKELERPDVFSAVHSPLRHLIVDEYQDVNPAQEKLISLLADSPVHLCVVGDDDQSIYQWRGSDVQNIVQFQKRYSDVRQFRIERNRRSRPAIIHAANAFGAGIEGRIAKSMGVHRSDSGQAEITCWTAETAEAEAEIIADSIAKAHTDLGYRYRDIAVLCRASTSFPTLLAVIKERGIPVQPGGRTNLFLQDDADLFGRTTSWLVDHGWRIGQFGWGDEPVTLDDLVKRYQTQFALSPKQAASVGQQLSLWKAKVLDENRPANLVKEFYELLGLLAIEHWDLTDVLAVNRLGSLARCSQVLVDYESTRRRARPSVTEPGQMRGGLDRGPKYYQWLAIYIQNWAKGYYEDFEGEEDVELDAVDLTTIHQAKGLEWPLVFVPALTARRFPSSRTGRAGIWHVPDHLFNRGRYEGSVNDERRLFYVAMTRARDFLSLSAFERLTKKQKPSPFLEEVAAGPISSLKGLPDPVNAEQAVQSQEVLEISFSDLAAYKECGLSYRLRRLVGFQPPLAPELGYGKAVHHLLRQVAEHVRKYRRKPTQTELDGLFDEEFYLPAANAAGYKQMKDRARKLVDRYVTDWEADLHKTWAVERPFELHVGGAIVIGRADVILDESGGGQPTLSIVDYKTATDGHQSHEFQLQVYVDAGRREGLHVERAFVHDLRDATRTAVPTAEADIKTAEDLVNDLLGNMRARSFAAKPGPACVNCDVRTICKERAG